MKKVLAASVGLLLTVATAAHADNWSRDRDPGNQKEASQSGGESRGNDGGNRGGNDGGNRGSGSGRSGGNQPSSSSAMFQDVDARGSNQRSSPEYSEDNARSQAQQYGSRQQQAGAYQAQAGGSAYQGGDAAQREGSGYRGDRRALADQAGSGSSGGYQGGDRGGYSGGDRGGYSGGDRGGYDNRHRGGYDNDRYDNRYRGGYSGSRHGYRGGYDHYRGYRGNWNNHRYRSPWRYSYPRGYGYRSWSVGLFLPSVYYSPTYYVDYAPYGLQPPPYGYEWVRVDADVLLVEIRTGRIVDVLYGFFY